MLVTWHSIILGIIQLRQTMEMYRSAIMLKIVGHVDDDVVAPILATSQYVYSTQMLQPAVLLCIVSCFSFLLFAQYWIRV